VKSLIFIASKTPDFPSPTGGRGSPAGAGEGALAGRITLVPNPLPPVGEGTKSGVLSLVCGAKISSATRVHVSLPRVGEGTRPVLLVCIAAYHESATV
jgi:hypothetical protein